MEFQPGCPGRNQLTPETYKSKTHIHYYNQLPIAYLIRAFNREEDFLKRNLQQF